MRLLAVALTAGPIAQALAGPIRAGGGTATPLWLLILAGAAALVVAMVFLVVAETLVPSGSLPGPLELRRAPRAGGPGPAGTPRSPGSRCATASAPTCGAGGALWTAGVLCVFPLGLVPVAFNLFGVDPQVRVWFEARYLPQGVQLPVAAGFVVVGLAAIWWAETIRRRAGRRRPDPAPVPGQLPRRPRGRGPGSARR